MIYIKFFRTRTGKEILFDKCKIAGGNAMFYKEDLSGKLHLIHVAEGVTMFELAKRQLHYNKYTGDEVKRVTYIDGFTN